MKSLILFFTLLLHSSVFSLPVGNPSDARLLTCSAFCCEHCPQIDGNICSPWCESLSLRIGFYGDYVWDRQTKIADRNRHGTVLRTEINTNAAFLALNLCNRIDFFSTLGISSIDLQFGGIDFGKNGNEWVFVCTDTHFSWSFGTRLSFWECKCFSSGIEAQYFHTQPNINAGYDEQDLPVYVEGRKMKYSEWQVGWGLAYKIPLTMFSSLTPYLGVKWSHLKIDSNNTQIDVDPSPANPLITLFDLKNNRELGYAIGVTLVGCSTASITVEGRFYDEKALYLNGQIRF